HSNSQKWSAAAWYSTGHCRGNIHWPQSAVGFFLQTEDQESIYADRGFGLSRTHRKHVSGDLCSFAARGAGECSTLGNKTSVHPAGLRAFGWTESLSTLSEQ